METEPIETFLENLGLQRYLDRFKESEVDLVLLLDLSENEFNKISENLKLPIGAHMKIFKGLQSLKKRRE